jgi:transposase-like protein
MNNPQPKPKRRYKRYSSEFKREALLRAGEEGMTDGAVCDELGISTRRFKRWRDELSLLGKDAFPGSGFSRDQDLAPPAVIIWARLAPFISTLSVRQVRLCSDHFPRHSAHCRSSGNSLASCSVPGF